MAIILTRPNSSIAKLFANSHPITDHASGPCEVPSCRKTPGVRNAPVIFGRRQWTGENNVLRVRKKRFGVARCWTILPYPWEGMQMFSQPSMLISLCIAATSSTNGDNSLITDAAFP